MSTYPLVIKLHFSRWIKSFERTYVYQKISKQCLPITESSIAINDLLVHFRISNSNSISLQKATGMAKRMFSRALILGIKVFQCLLLLVIQKHYGRSNGGKTCHCGRKETRTKYNSLHEFLFGHNILRLFDISPNFSFTTSEANRGY